jgi:NDP-sugar pyrophosphorylase family protein
MAYFGDGSRWKIKLDYSLEDEPLGTIGPLTLLEGLPDNFLVMNGDVLCDLDYRAFFDAHAARGSDVSVSVFRREVLVDFGVLRYSAEHDLTHFEEKPSLGFDVSMGIYCINRRVVAALPRGKPYGFDNLMLDSLKAGRRVKVMPFGGYWLDIGRTEDYQYADEHFDELAARLRLGIS